MTKMEYVTSNISLSWLAIENRRGIPLYRILQIKPFSILNTNFIELKNAIQKMNDNKYLDEEGKILKFRLPFTVIDNRIILKNIPGNTKEADISLFIEKLTNEKVKFVAQSISTMTLEFKNTNNMFAFWRALTYVPFNNVYLDAQAVARMNDKDNKGFKKKRKASKNEKRKMPMQAQTPPSSPSRDIKIQKKANGVIKFELGKNIDIHVKKAADI